MLSEGRISMKKIKFLFGLMASVTLMLMFVFIVNADEILELQYESIVVDLGYKNEQIVYSVDFSDFITTVPSNLSLAELNFSSADSSIAFAIENDYQGTVTIIGEDYGYTTINVSNDNFTEVIPVYVVYPRSGSEPDYDPISWNFKAIRENRNCYSYALDILEPVNELDAKGFNYFADPGDITHAINNTTLDNPIDTYDENLKKFLNYAKLDLLALNNTLIPNKTFKCLDLNNNYRVQFEELLGIKDPNKFTVACDPGTYKVVLVRDDAGGMHWYRQDSNGLWSHKNGWDYATNYGCENKLIISPITTNESCAYGGYFYVGCFQVPVWR